MTLVEDAARSRFHYDSDLDSVDARSRRWPVAAIIAAIVLIGIVVACVIGPWLAPSPRAQDLANRVQPPSWSHWMGTDELGRDVFSRVLSGGRVSLVVAFGTAIIGATLGAMLGVTAGTVGGWFDAAVTQLADLALILPIVPVAAVIAGVDEVGGWGPLPAFDPASGLGMAVVLGLFLWGGVARVVRARARAVATEEFVAAAHGLGLSRIRVVTRHVLPHCAGPIAVETTLLVAAAMLLESTLSFLGFGVGPPTPTWGSMLSSSVGAFDDRWWLVAFPGGAIVLTVLCVHVFAAGVRDQLDPRRVAP